jgi:hypothetical protein
MSIDVAVTYRREWQDGYGARGWKLDVSLHDPEVIASTAETGLRLPTSVLIHDILDHHLCGLALGGHRNEAIALHQLGLRTGADPFPDIAQMVDEDLMHGGVVGESMRDFLPDALRALLPDGLDDNRAVAHHLAAALGRDGLRQALIERMLNIGRVAAETARARYRQSGLDHACRGALGLALQGQLARIDARAVDEDWAEAHGAFVLTDEHCALWLDRPRPIHLDTRYT